MKKTLLMIALVLVSTSVHAEKKITYLGGGVYKCSGDRSCDEFNAKVDMDRQREQRERDYERSRELKREIERNYYNEEESE